MPGWLQLFEIARFGRPIALFLSLLVVGWALRRLMGRGMATMAMPVTRRFMNVAPALALAAFLAISAWYAVDSRYYDFAEPTMPAVAWMFEIGQPLYPAPGAPERYAHIYGPMAFIPLAFAMRVAGPDLRAVKWLSTSAALLGLLILFVALRSRTTPRHALMFTGVSALLFLIFRNTAFWPRPDSLELLCVSLGLWAASNRSLSVGWIILGASAGVLWNLKFSGPLYSLPLFVLLFERAGARRVILATVVAIAVFALPFLVFPNVAFGNYVTWIRLSARHGIVWSTLRLNVEWALFLLVPLILANRTLERRTPPKVSRTVLIALCLAMCSVVVLASKPGAGPYHLLPFVPAICFLTAIQIPDDRVLDDAPTMVVWAFLAFSVTATLIALAQQASFISTVRQIDAVEPLADVTQFWNEHPNDTIEVGYSSDERMTFVRPALVFHTGTYLLDQPAIQEHQLAGLAIPESTVAALRSCAVAFWLIPKGGVPFSSTNRYPQMAGRALFDDGFRRAFFESYRQVGSTRFFDVWTCRAATRR
jgi:hypothetical protein